MHALITAAIFISFCACSDGFHDPFRGYSTHDMLLRYTPQSHQSCLLEGRSDLVERCEVPVDGHLVPVDDTTVRFPRHSVCHLKRFLPKVNTCIVCRGGSWETGTCVTAFREKRFFWFVVGVVVGVVVGCILFCRRKGGGGGSTDYKPPSFSKCEGPAPEFYADRGKTSTAVTWPEPEAKDGSGKAIKTKRTQGRGDSGFEFEKGFHYITYKATDSKGFSDYCQFSFEVKVRRCKLNWIVYGKRKCDNDNYIYGTKCQVSCVDGYELQGAAELTCEENGWNHPIPTCKPKPCPALSGDFQCSDGANPHVYGSICSLSCDRSQGLSVTNPSITICLRSGSWLVPIPQCQDHAPPIFDNCPTTSIVQYADQGVETATVTWEDITATDNSGQVTVTQTDGLNSGSVFSSGTSVIKYTARDGGGNQAQCVFNVVIQVLTCGPPPYTDNKMRFDCTKQYVYGSRCSINCVGALLNGSNSITCQKDNAIPPTMHWETNTDQPPICIQNNCVSLSVPENGALACDTNLLGSFCVMSCNTKWDIPISAPSNNMYICGWKSGTWFPNANVPDCTAERVPGQMRLPSEFQYYTGNCNDPATQEQIKQHHIAILNSSSFFFPDGCISSGMCSVKDVEVRCGTTTRRRRDTMETNQGNVLHSDLYRKKRSETAVTVSWDFAVNYDCGNRSTADCLTYLENLLFGLRNTTQTMLSNGDFNPSIPGVSVRNDSYRYQSVRLQCGEGMKPVLSSGSCAVCPTGTMYNSTSDDCMDCRPGSYQDEDHSFSCKDCPQGTTSLSSGSRSSSDCKDMCRPGNISATGIEPCTPCPVGGYQSVPGSTSCVTCPVGTTTEKTGAAATTECQSYDLSIQGLSTLTSSVSTTEDVNSFTLFLWVKVNSPSPGLTIAFTSDNVKVQINSTVSVSFKGNQAGTEVPVDVNKWLPITIVFDYSSKQLTVYKGGQAATTATVSTVSSPVIVTASTLTVNCTSTEGVDLRSLSFIKVIKSPAEVTALSTTCDVTKDSNTVMTLDNMNGGAADKVKVIIPSSCDAVDECMTSDPCNGHPCVNTPGSYSCQCQDGYTGNDCTTPPNFCSKHRCENGASCVSGQTNYTCTCAVGFKGSLCEVMIVHGGYSNWTDWSACPVTCGGGVETRSRSCTNPPPDVDGQPCSGPNVENRDCNTDPCPVCRSTQLQLGANNSESGPTCTGNDSELTCVVKCKPGFYISRDQLSGCNCTNGQWTPSTQLPSCLEILSPKNLTLKTKVNFTNPGCPSQQESGELKSSLETKLQTLECEKMTGCVSKVDVPDCSEISSGTSADISFTVDLPDTELNIDPSVTVDTMPQELRTVIEAIRTLEATAQQLQNESSEILEVTSGGVTYTPGADITLTPEVTCRPGYFDEDGFCGPCPEGTYHDDGTKRCEFCPKGWYQDMTGQVECSQCPSGTSTLYTGSIHTSQCNVTADVSESTTSTERIISSSAPSATTHVATSTTSTSVGTSTKATTFPDRTEGISHTLAESTTSTESTISTSAPSTNTPVASSTPSTNAPVASSAPSTNTPVASSAISTSVSTSTTSTTSTIRKETTSHILVNTDETTERSATIKTTSQASIEIPDQASTPASISNGTAAEQEGMMSTRNVIIIVCSIVGALIVVAVLTIAVICIKSSRKKTHLYVDDRHKYARPNMSTSHGYSNLAPERNRGDHENGGYTTIPDEKLNSNPYVTSTNIYNEIFDSCETLHPNHYYHYTENNNYQPSDMPAPDY